MTTTLLSPPPHRRRFPGISSRAWEHPADRAALSALRAVPGFDGVVKWIFGMFTERGLRAVYLGSAVQVGPDQYPRIHRVYLECLDVLDIATPYQLFVAQNPVLNAGAVGWEEPFIVLNSGTVHALDDDQLRYVIAHELGHIQSGHVLYKTMLGMLLRAANLALGMPLTGIALFAVIAALLEWDRKSELSSDRCGALVCQDPEAVRQALLRMAGGVAEGANVDAFREQARRYDEGGNVLDGLARTLALLGRTHPFPVQRLHELDRWIESGEYARVLAGEYPDRKDDPADSPWRAWTEAASHYSERARHAADPLSRLVRGAAGRASGMFRGEPKE